MLCALRPPNRYSGAVMYAGSFRCLDGLRTLAMYVTRPSLSSPHLIVLQQIVLQQQV